MFKTKNYTIIIVILIGMINIACQENRIRTDLLTADSIMDKNPDSAYVLLSKITDAEKLEDYCAEECDIGSHICNILN